MIVLQHKAGCVNARALAVARWTTGYEQARDEGAPPSRQARPPRSRGGRSGRWHPSRAHLQPRYRRGPGGKIRPRPLVAWGMRQTPRPPSRCRAPSPACRGAASSRRHSNPPESMVTLKECAAPYADTPARDTVVTASRPAPTVRVSPTAETFPSRRTPSGNRGNTHARIPQRPGGILPATGTDRRRPVPLAGEWSAEPFPQGEELRAQALGKP